MNSSFSLSRFGVEEAAEQGTVLGVFGRVERDEVLAHRESVPVGLDEPGDVVADHAERQGKRPQRRVDGGKRRAVPVHLGEFVRGSSLSDWQRVLDVNLTGAYLGMRAVIEPMIARGGGSIVNISSVEGLAGSAHLHAYVAAKFGLRGITKSAAVELAAYGIRVNSIHPGLVHTPMSKGVTEEFMAPIPMRRGAAPGEVAAFVLFLVSDESAYATGAEFVVDGGLTSYVPVKV
jgi:3alpha(or 20beta)-hydroxysteroid dehydrogenase